MTRIYGHRNRTVRVPSCQFYGTGVARLAFWAVYGSYGIQLTSTIKSMRSAAAAPQTPRLFFRARSEFQVQHAVLRVTLFRFADVQIVLQA